MQNFDYICRKARPDDDISAIARYIYLTDPYIYPTICKEPDNEDWLCFICQCIKTPHNVYGLDNISVVEHHGEIVGIACVVGCGKKLSITDGVNVPKDLKAGLDVAVQGYFVPLIEESLELDGTNVVNVCVDGEHRGKGVGSLLMAYIVGEYGKDTMHLDVIASNDVAIRTYERHGFSVTRDYFGFSGDEMPLLCYHMIRK